MARIETYQPDYVITPNDFVIGTDGDNFNKTKNYSVIAMLDYVGTHFNLQSADLVYNYTPLAPLSVLDGEFTVNNRLDATVLFSGVTTFSISKTTVFGRLVDDYIQTLGDEGFSFMLYDFSNYNNFGVYTITSVVDLNSDIFTIAVTLDASNGDIDGSSTYGFKAYPTISGGSGVTDGDKGDITVSGGGTSWLVNDGYVDLVNSQTIAGNKSFSNFIVAKGGYESNATNAALNVFSMFRNSNVPSGDDNGGAAGQLYLNNNNNWSFLSTSTGGRGFVINNDNLTTLRTFILPNKDGTIALLDDLDNFVTINTTQVITGTKVFDTSTYVTMAGGLLIGDGFTTFDALDNVVWFTDESNPNTIQSSSFSGLFFTGKNLSVRRSGADTEDTWYSFIGDNITSPREHTLQNRDGTLAHLDQIPTISNLVYDESLWNGNLDGASKNAIRDEIEDLRDVLTPVNQYNDFKKTIVNGTGLGSTGGFSVGSITDTTKPMHFLGLFEAQGADLSDLVLTMEVATSSTPSDVTLPTLASSTATQPILVEGSFSLDGTTITLVGKITTNEEVIPFFQTFTSVSGTAWELRITNPAASGGNVRQEYNHYWQ